MKNSKVLRLMPKFSYFLLILLVWTPIIGAQDEEKCVNNCDECEPRCGTRPVPGGGTGTYSDSSCDSTQTKPNPPVINCWCFNFTEHIPMCNGRGNGNLGGSTNLAAILLLASMCFFVVTKTIPTEY